MNINSIITPMSEEKVKHIHKILSSISGKESKVFKDVDVEDPVSWSNALKPFGWKLAFCNSKLDYIIENVFNMGEDGKYIVEVCVDGARAFGQKLLRKEQNDEGYALNKGLRLVEVEDNSMKIGDSTFDSDNFVLRIFRVVPADHPKEI